MIKELRNRIKALPLRRLSLATLSFFGVLIIILLIWKVPQWQARGIKDAVAWVNRVQELKGEF